jgi:aldose 1-epimerase
MKLFARVFIAIFFLAACKLMTKEEKSKNASENKIAKANLEINFYGMIGEDSVFEYKLTNTKGMVVKILNYGATVTQIMVPDKKGKMGDVVLGFDSLSGYLQSNNPYFGCVVGRYANRIANARFTLDGKEYALAPNNDGNTLHGGLKGFDKVIWTLKGKEINDEHSTLGFQYHSRDGEEGYPGNMEITVAYSLLPTNELKIDYIATTDKPTPVNLTNHCYFNLSAGADSTILEHELMLKADKYTPVNNKLIPTGKIEPVKGTAMDFTAAKKIGKEIAEVDGGYDHNWVLNRTGNGAELVGSLYHGPSGRFMEVFTTEPGVQFYSGNFLNGTLSGKSGKKYVKHAGLCLETQHFPDSPNQPGFPNTILKPGDVYHQTTIYKFSVKEP